MHQIRRHLSGLGYPLIGDTRYGDGETNQSFKQNWEISRLWLHALALTFTHPDSGQTLKLRANFHPDWHRAFDEFGLCPIGSDFPSVPK
jgi:23S rRNA-/tRNA-specific pseudouridylate synthase